MPVSGGGLLSSAPLITTDLAAPQLVGQQGFWHFYLVRLTAKGQRLLDVRCSGNREQIRLALTELSPEAEEREG